MSVDGLWLISTKLWVGMAASDGWNWQFIGVAMVASDRWEWRLVGVGIVDNVGHSRDT